MTPVDYVEKWVPPTRKRVPKVEDRTQKDQLTASWICLRLSCLQEVRNREEERG
jgi:hypothetical protein